MTTEHKTLTARVTETDTDQDLGVFEAIASAWEADREGDTIARHAFDKTIAAWIGSQKKIPLLFEHSTTVVGSIDPESMHPTDAGLIVAGEVDRSTDEGKQAWRSIKAGSAGFSIGFMSESRSRPGGGRELVEIDLLEVSVTSTPAHPATRATSWKSANSTTALVEREWAIVGHAWETARAKAEVKAIEQQTKARDPIQVKTFDC